MEPAKGFDLSPDGEDPKEPNWARELADLRNWAIKQKGTRLNDRPLEEQNMLARLLELQNLATTLFGLQDDKRPAAWEEYAELLRWVAKVIDRTLGTEAP